MHKLFLLVFTILLAGCQTTFHDRLSVNGTELDYIVSGNGPPLYLLHGGMESRDSFDAQIPVLAKHFTVVAMDSREQARSGPAEAQITYDLMAQDVVSLAKHLGHERISIIGQSDGGVTALTTAIHHPDKIDRLILMGATFHYDSYPPETLKYISEYEWDGNTDPNEFPGNFIKHYLTGKDDLSGFNQQIQEMAVMWTTSPAFSEADLGQVKAKTLVINGDHEDTPLNHVIALHKAIPNADLFIVPNATHYVLQEKPDLINRVLLDFLETD